MPHLKAALHCHTRKDRKDFIKHSEIELIDRAFELGFEILAITCHDIVAHTPELEKYAFKKGVLLIPGIEKTIEKKHVLVLNPDQAIEQVQTFSDLKKYKKEKPDILIIAPHPFYWTRYSLRKKLIPNLELFDAIEHSFFYSPRINPNQYAALFACSYNLPLIGTFDNHCLAHFKSPPTYTVIHSEKNLPSVFKALKNGQFEIVTRPLSLLKMFFIQAQYAWQDGRKYGKIIKAKKSKK